MRTGPVICPAETSIVKIPERTPSDLPENVDECYALVQTPKNVTTKFRTSISSCRRVIDHLKWEHFDIVANVERQSRHMRLEIDQRGNEKQHVTNAASRTHIYRQQTACLIDWFEKGRELTAVMTSKSIFGTKISRIRKTFDATYMAATARTSGRARAPSNRAKQ